MLTSTIIEDDQVQSELLRVLLESHNISSSVINDYEHACQLIDTGINSDIVLLDYDLNSDKGDGVDLCNRIDSSSDAFVLVLTGSGKPELSTDFLNAGARQFIRKPYDFQDLLARIKKLAARKSGIQHQKEEKHLGKPALDFNLGLAHFTGISISMSGKELELFELLLENEGNVVFREDINYIVGNQAGNSRYADTLVTKLRRRLTKVPDDIRVSSIRGHGYQLVRKNLRKSYIL